MGYRGRGVEIGDIFIGKIINSPNEHFTGTVELYDPLTYPQVVAYQEAIAEVQSLIADNGEVSMMKLRLTLLPSILDCVSKWKLANIPKRPTVKTFPATPIIDATLLWEWLQEELNSLLVGVNEVPKE